MKSGFMLIFILILTSCSQDKNSAAEKSNPSEIIYDTLIVRYKSPLNHSYEVGIYSKSYFYYWVVGKDTLDFVVHATEYKKDSTLHLSFLHKNPILFKEMLYNTNKCLPIIRKDFEISKLSSLYFRSPIYYLDLIKNLSNEYEQKYERKNISYQKLNEFLLTSSLNAEVNKFLKPLNRKVKSYSIEKFHLMEKKHFDSYVKGADLSEYPEFTVHGMGIDLRIGR